MKSIAINTKYVQFPLVEGKTVANEGFKGSFFIKSEMEDIGVREEMSVIVARPEGEDLKFESEGIIDRVKNIETIRPSREKIDKAKAEGRPLPKNEYHHYFDISILKALKLTNLLSDLEYSLKFVDRFNKPIVHFQQQVRELNEKDFETIINGYIYTARTAFGKLINSIPRENKLEFMLQAMNRFDTIDFRKVPLEDGLSFLQQYIGLRILNRGRLLVETNNLIKQNLGDLVKPDEIGFRHPDTGKENLLSEQASVFVKIFELEKKSDFKTAVNKAIGENSELEIRFKKMFERETWPIDLTV